MIFMLSSSAKKNLYSLYFLFPNTYLSLDTRVKERRLPHICAYIDFAKEV